MRGYSHALSGAAGWLALTSSSDAALAWSGQGPAVTLAGTVLCAGAALLPDLDHAEGTISWSLPTVALGPLTLIPSPTRALCEGVEAISGGHRHATHSYVGVGVFTLLAYGLSLLAVTIDGRTVAVGAGVFAVLLVAFASKALGLNHAFTGRRGSLASSVMRSWLGVWAVALGSAGIATWFLDYRWPWLPAAVFLGAFLHCVGDTLTTQGVPWMWPWHPRPPGRLKAVPVVGWVATRFWLPNGYFRMHVLGDTDSWRERILGAVMGLYVTYIAIFEVASLYGANMLY